MRNITGDITNCILRKKENRVYYFDENGIYKSILIEEIENSSLKNWKFREDASFYFFNTYHIYISKNDNIIKKAVCMLKENDTIEDFDNYLSEVKLEKRQKPQGIDRFITKIEKPIFGRTVENDKKNTFDFIYLDINIVTQWPTSKKEYIQKNMSTIKKKAINKIKESGEFKKYGIPVNFLRITKCSLNNDVIELIFELKEI